MAPAIAIQLISQYGVPAAKAIYDVYKTWKDKKEITDADWADMLAINARPLEFYEKYPLNPTPIPAMPWNEKP